LKRQSSSAFNSSSVSMICRRSPRLSSDIFSSASRDVSRAG
jgi:hypothetical protein